jgi:hypothetical protein
VRGGGRSRDQTCLSRKFPAIGRKTGNCRLTGPVFAILVGVGGAKPTTYSETPYAAEQRNFLNEQGILTRAGRESGVRVIAHFLARGRDLFCLKFLEEENEMADEHRPVSLWRDVLAGAS